MLSGIAVVEVERGIGAVEKEMALLLRHPEQGGDRLQRELGRDVDEEVARASLDRVVDDRPAPFGKRSLDLMKALRTYRRRHEPADTVVSRVVLHVEQDSGAEAQREILDDCPAAVPVAAAD